MFTIATGMENDPRTVPPTLREWLRHQVLTDVERGSGVSRGALTNMRDKGRARPDTISKVSRYAEAAEAASSAPAHDDVTRLKALIDSGAHGPQALEVRELISLLASAASPEERERLFRFVTILDRVLP